jgi:hypothetical protein
MIDANDYLRGMKDCQDGVPHKAGESADYDRGYSAQYTQEQNLSELVK